MCEFVIRQAIANFLNIGYGLQIRSQRELCEFVIRQAIANCLNIGYGLQIRSQREFVTSKSVASGNDYVKSVSQSGEIPK